MKKFQADFVSSKSADDIGSDYLIFFTDIHDFIREVEGKQNRIATREQLCSIFQVIAIGSFHVKSTQKIPDPHGFGGNLVLT